MCTHYICGINDCKNFAHVIYMSQEISKLLPFFKYEIMSLNKEDFEEWYHHFFTVNNLMTLRRHMSPVVWRQWLGDGSRTSVELIGGFSEFVEFCKSCLHVDSLWTPKEVEALSEKILKTASLVPPVEGFCVCILGAGHPSTRLLVFELLTNAKSIFNQSLHLLLCDCTCGSNEKMKQIAKDALYLQEESIVEVVSTLDVALKHCQLLIITKQIDRKQDNILSMYFDFMVDVADLFVKHSRRSCRILLACTGYSCFNASVFMREYARVNGKQVPPNIAAVTSYKATECLHFLKHASSARMEELFGTPVWGFIEQNEGLVVDYLMTKYIRTKKMLVLPDGLLSLESILSKDTTLNTLSSNFEIESETNASKSYKTEEGEEEDSELDLENELVDMLMKGIRSDSVKFEYVKSSATLAEIEYKLRNVRDFVKLQKDSIFFLFDEEPLIPQVNATIDLLRFWYDKDEPDSTSQNCPSNEKIVFAGIPTDGSFGMKSGLVLSQPAVLNNDYLVPYAEYTEQRSYGKNKLDRAYTMVDSFGLYWDYGNYETDMLLKTLWLKFGDEIRQKTDLTTTEEKEAPTDYVRSLKSRIKMAIKEQKTLLKELGAVAKREAKERGEISEIELSDLDLETETIKSVSKKSKEEKISGVVSVERETEEEKIIDDIEIEPSTEIKSQAESIKVEESTEEPGKTSEESGVVLTDSVFKENVVIDEIQNVMEPLTDKRRLSVGSKNDKSLANLSRKSDEKEQINTLSEGDKLIIEENIQNEAIDNQIENKSLSKHSKDSERQVIETEKEKDLIGNEEKEVVPNEDLTEKKTLSSHSKDNIQSEVQLITEPELENVLETNLVEGGDTKNEDVQNENQTEKKSLSNKSKENIESEVQKETVENINTDLTDEGDTKIEDEI